MKIILTSWSVARRTGAELHVCELALALKARGCETAIYTVGKGELAQSAGVPVFTRPGRAPFQPDIIHGHHQPALAEALAAWPDTPALFVVHDADSPLDEPLPLPRVRRHVAVDHRCLKRLGAISPDERRVMLNFVDLDRFLPRPPLPPKPRRALIFSNYAQAGGDLAAIQSACTAAGVELDVIGAGVGASETAPETRLAAYDIVFAKARAAIEAMAVGCAVVLCDFAGLGGMVTAAEFRHLRDFNFGAGVLTGKVTHEAVLAELQRYDPVDSAAVSESIRAEAGLESAAADWIALYREILALPPVADGLDDQRQLNAVRQAWRSRRTAAAFQFGSEGMRSMPGMHALYRAGRGLWRAVGSPGALVAPRISRRLR